MTNGNTVTEALEAAHKELYDRGSREVEDGGLDPQTMAVLNKIEQAQAVVSLSLAERIERAYNEVCEQKRIMQKTLREFRGWEAATKLEHGEEWAAAKNDNVRKVLLDGWLEEDLDYQKARDSYESHRDRYRLALLEIERLKLLVEARKAGER